MIFMVMLFLFNFGLVLSETGKETDLHSKLFREYNPDVKPVINNSDTINILLKLYVMSIDNIDEKGQSFSTRAFLEVQWTNEFLRWDPGEFSGVTSINVKTEKIWLPDLALQEVYDRPTDMGLETGRAIVDYNGSVIVWPYKLYTVSCKMKIYYFPFDAQECELDFLPWTNPSSIMRLLPNTEGAISFETYNESGEWVLDKYKVTHYQKPYGDDTWDHIKFTFSLKRKWLFQVMNIIAPIVCISLLNLTCFVVPAESGEKVALCISMFLTLAVILTTITSILPESSDEVSILGIYVCVQLFGSGISIVCVVMSLFLYHREPDIPVHRLLLLLCKTFNQFRLDNNTVKCPTQNGLRSSCGIDSDDNPFAENVISVTWANVSRAFDRLCFVLSVCWNAVLLSGLAIAYND